MSSVISGNYRELTSPEEIESVADECAHAWQDYKIPMRQFEIVKPELDALREGKPCAPFAALFECLKYVSDMFLKSRPTLLDVGASAGYYYEVLKTAGYDVRYTAVDFSRAFQRFAEAVYPEITDFDVADASSLPYHDDTFDVVLHGACIMHCHQWQKVIEEAARVSRRYAIFHRTPITDQPTSYFEKEAYGVRCLEVHFNEAELLTVFEANGLYLQHTAIVFTNGTFSHRSYLLESLNHVQV